MAGKIGVFIFKFVLLAKENSLNCTNLKGLVLSTNPLRDRVRLDSDWFFAFVLLPASSDISWNHSDSTSDSHSNIKLFCLIKPFSKTL